MITPAPEQPVRIGRPAARPVTDTKTWTRWIFGTAEFLDKLGLPAQANVISVEVRFPEHSVTVVAAGSPEENGTA